MKWVRVQPKYGLSYLVYKAGTKRVGSVNRSPSGPWYVPKLSLPESPKLKVVPTEHEAIAIVESAVNQWLLDANLVVNEVV